MVIMMIASYKNDDDRHHHDDRIIHNDDDRHHHDDRIVYVVYALAMSDAIFFSDGGTDKASLGVGCWNLLTTLKAFSSKQPNNKYPPPSPKCP